MTLRNHTKDTMVSSGRITVERAEDVIPDTATLVAHGISCDLEQARDLLVIISRIFARGDSKDRNYVYNGMSLIVPGVTAEIRTDDEHLLALAPPLEVKIPVGTTALKRIGLEAADVGELWGRRLASMRAAFPLGMMTTVLPPSAWPHLVQFLNGGPAEAQTRLGEAIRQRAREGMKVGGLKHRIQAAWIVMGCATEVRADVEASNERRRRAGRAELTLSPSLDPWTWIPVAPTKGELVNMGASTDKRDTSAVPVPAIREALKRLAREAEWGKWPPESWPPLRNWRALKRFVTLVLLVTASPRIDHLRLFDVDDFAWHRFHDGIESWGLRFRGEAMKKRDAGNVYWKRLPPEVGEIVHSWIVCSGRELGQSGAPLLTSHVPHTPGAPGKRYVNGSLSPFISGNPPSRNTGYPFGSVPLIRFDDQQWKGYQSHRYRSFVIQHVESLVHAWKIENPSNVLSGVETKVFGEMLLDHATDDVGYRDFDFKPRYEQIVGLGIELIWNSVWGEGAARKGIDLDRMADALGNLNLLRAKAGGLQNDLDQREQRKYELRAQKNTLFERARRAKGEAREDLRFELDAVQSGIDDLNDEIASMLRNQVASMREVEIAQAELRDAQHVHVALPDDFSEDAYQERLAVLLGDGPQQSHFVPAPMSEELASSDVAELCDVHAQTIWRWRTGKARMPNPRPFAPEDWVKHDEKDYRLPVSAINIRAIPATDPEAALAAVRRKRAALGFNKRTARRRSVSAV
jgi:hypothetical protein